ncbi:glutamyl-tRNA reductase [Clostridium taeniosporum]|uniref:Glutamyl-tRNA reductase n=1 Tax=Clostridium taeniosporum TaxID=394958 RepID=A0A1D7XLM7_9CLOT|nr:glutamyl-tRNA reductase [Clostridium taeniosporum]AOR24248.1 glutamyl-tRNA reductase [Clostridium taeniosporum]
MIAVLGIKKNTPIEIREKLTIKSNKYDKYLEGLLKYLDEVIILATCNRTEIYFNVSYINEELLKKIFEVLKWEYIYKDYIFISEDKRACKHLFEVTCGFHSKILGEDQILGQVRDVYFKSLNANALNLDLQRLFQYAITCGKKFKSQSRLFEIPVSSASIVVNESINKKCKRYMILGYGDVGRLTMKYLLAHNIEDVYLAVRNTKIKNEFSNDKVKVIKFEEKNKYINDMDCVISCTSAPHIVIKKQDINEWGNKILIYDLAVPRDVDEEINNIHRAEVYNIDKISYINDGNKKMRFDKMDSSKFILEKYLNEYYEWKRLRSIVPIIEDLKISSKEVYDSRISTFKNKCKDKDDIELANKMIKSTSDYYVNRAIEIMKEETLKGSEEECLRIIKSIFMTQN